MEALRHTFFLSNTEISDFHAFESLLKGSFVTNPTYSMLSLIPRLFVTLVTCDRDNRQNFDVNTPCLIKAVLDHLTKMDIHPEQTQLVCLV